MSAPLTLDSFNSLNGFQYPCQSSPGVGDGAKDVEDVIRMWRVPSAVTLFQRYFGNTFYRRSGPKITGLYHFS